MSTLKVNAIQGTDGVERYTARAWVNFNGTGTVAIRAAGNVSSITDNGTGDYTINFTNAMPDANYSACGSANAISADLGIITVQPFDGTYPRTASSIRIFTGFVHATANRTATDASVINLEFFR